MKKLFKNIVALALVALVTAGASSAFMANTMQNQNCQGRNGGQECRMDGQECLMNGAMRGFMRDEDGNMLDRVAFVLRLDALIAEGTIPAADRAFFLERFDLCVENCEGNGQRMGGYARGMRAGGGNCRNR